jgi:hypothetical protein
MIDPAIFEKYCKIAKESSVAWFKVDGVEVTFNPYSGQSEQSKDPDPKKPSSHSPSEDDLLFNPLKGLI